MNYKYPKEIFDFLYHLWPRIIYSKKFFFFIWVIKKFNLQHKYKTKKEKWIIFKWFTAV